jgi:hypothetical protein
MPSSTTLEQIIGTSRGADEPQLHLNHEGAVVAITYTAKAWAQVEASRKSERNGQRSVVTTCPIRGVVSVDAYVIPAFTAATPKPWSRAQRAGYAFFAEAA